MKLKALLSEPFFCSIDGASNVIDIFGVPGEDGSNTCHDFEDGIALRAGTNTDPNGGTWNEAGWTVYSDYSTASGCTDHNANQPQNAADIAPLVSNWGIIHNLRNLIYCLIMGMERLRIKPSHGFLNCNTKV